MEALLRPSEVMATFQSGDETEQVLGCPGLGFIPAVAEEGLRLIKDISTFSPLMEAYRSLRVNLRFATSDAPVRSLLITSSVPAEGKTTTVANLAMALAMAKKCVLVVDADLRRPALHKVFKTNAHPGLVDVLNGNMSLDDAIRPTSVGNVAFLPAGTPPNNPTELLESEEMTELLATAQGRYGYVLLDSSPALAVADAMVLSALADGTLLVIGYGETKVESVRKTMTTLKRAKATVLGTVLNRMHGPAGGYYYGKYYVPSADKPAGETEAATPPE